MSSCRATCRRSSVRRMHMKQLEVRYWSWIRKLLGRLHLLEPADPAYTIVRALRFRGLLNVEALRMAFAFLVDRHPSLRIAISPVEGELVQEVANRPWQEFKVIAAEEWDESKLRAHIA